MPHEVYLRRRQEEMPQSNSRMALALCQVSSSLHGREDTPKEALWGFSRSQAVVALMEAYGAEGWAFPE